MDFCCCSSRYVLYLLNLNAQYFFYSSSRQGTSEERVHIELINHVMNLKHKMQEIYRNVTMMRLVETVFGSCRTRQLLVWTHMIMKILSVTMYVYSLGGPQVFYICV